MVRPELDTVRPSGWLRGAVGRAEGLAPATGFDAVEALMAMPAHSALAASKRVPTSRTSGPYAFAVSSMRG